MPIDPSIPLSVQVPQPTSPLQTISGLMQVRDASSQIALRNAQTLQAQQNAADIQAQAQQRQRDLADQNTLQAALADPDMHTKLMLGDTSGIAGKVQPKTELALQQSALKAATDRATLNNQQLTQRSTAEGEIADTIAGLKSLTDANGNPDLPRINASIGPAIAGLTKTGAFQAIGMDPSAFTGKSITDPSQLDQLAASIGAQKALTDKVLAQKKTTAETTEAGAKATEANAQAAKFNQDVQLTQSKIAATNALTAPGALEAVVNGRIPAQYPEFRAAALAAAQAAVKYNPGDPGKVSEAIEHVAGNADAIAKGANPINIKAEAAKAAATAAATAPVEINKAVQTQLALNKASGAALANVPYHLTTAATSAYAKAGQEFVTATNAANEMQDLIDAARSGNKVAYAYAPTTGVLTINSANGTKRVNMAEIEQYGGAGSDLDKVKQFFGKHLTGESIDSSVLGDMEQMHQTLAGNAQKTHENAVSAVNQAYGSQFKPIALPNGAKTSAAAAVPANVQKALSNVGPGIHTLSDGSKWIKSDDGAVTKQ